jgi:hypothetical protein
VPDSYTNFECNSPAIALTAGLHEAHSFVRRFAYGAVGDGVSCLLPADESAGGMALGAGFAVGSAGAAGALDPDSPVLAPSELGAVAAGGALGEAADGLAADAGSDGLGADGAGCTFCLVFGSAAAPAGGDCAKAVALEIARAEAARIVWSLMKKSSFWLLSPGEKTSPLEGGSETIRV